MIGNLLLKDGVVITVDGRTIFDIDFGIVSHNYEAIPLNEEWIKKMGFDYYEDADEGGITWDWYALNVEKESFVWCKEEGFVEWSLGRIYFVHDMQNIINVLFKGKKLIINP